MIILLLSGPALRSQKIDSYQSHWDTGLSPKDGEDFINKMQYEQKSQFLFYLSNDETNLYVYLIVSDRPNIQKIMRYGLTTWFNSEAKRKKSMGIGFPVATQEEARPQQPREGQVPGQGDRKDFMNRMLEGKNREMILIGFSGKGARDTVLLSQANGFQAKMDMMDRDKMLISLALPIYKLEQSQDGLPDNFISVGFETGYMDLNKQGIAPAGGSTSGEGGHGGGMYGGPPQGGQGGMDRPADGSGQQQQASISDLANPTKLWISSVKLAAH